MKVKRITSTHVRLFKLAKYKDDNDEKDHPDYIRDFEFCVA